MNWLNFMILFCFHWDWALKRYCLFHSREIRHFTLQQTPLCELLERLLHVCSQWVQWHRWNTVLEKRHVLGSERNYIITVSTDAVSIITKMWQWQKPAGRHDLNERQDGISSQSASPQCQRNLPAEVQQSGYTLGVTCRLLLSCCVCVPWKHTSCEQVLKSSITGRWAVLCTPQSDS